MGRINADAVRFIREIRCGIPRKMKGKQRILKQMKVDILTYVEENPNSDYQSLIERFGSPQQIISSYFQELDEEELIHQIKARKRIISIAVVTAALILVSWIGVVYSAMAEHFDHEGGYIVEELIDEGTVPSEKGE